VASDAFIDEGWKALKALRRSTPMGEKENKPFQLSFNGLLKVDF